MDARGERQWGPVPVPIMLRREPDRLPVSWAIVLERLREAVASGELASAGAAAEPSPGFSSPRH